VDHAAKPDRGPGADSRRRRAQADRGRAGELRESTGLDESTVIAQRGA
jgi:hypothetical protein